MLNYLVTSKTRRNLLKLLWLDSVSGTASELANKSGVAFAGAYKELKAMAESGLATLEWRNGRNVYSANRSHPMANLLHKMLKYKDSGNSDDLDENAKLKENLAFLGMPVNARKTPPESTERLESLIAKASNLAASDASVARAFPVFLRKVSPDLDFDVLKLESRKLGNKHRVGFFLDLAGDLGQDRALKNAAKDFFDSRNKLQKPFFMNPSKYSLKLAEERTPDLARKWGWSMNMGLDAFESTYRKFRNDTVPAK
jgi:Fe2+ or Zn2+ uptake regulation protein